MAKLSQLKGAGKKRKRVGRGGARGSFSGRGHSGQKKRSGAGIGVLFEGGQMPLVRRLPKRGFTNVPFKKEYAIISIGLIDKHFVEGEEVTIEALRAKKIIKGATKVRLKVLADGTLSKKVSVTAHAFSKKAREAVEAGGGTAVVIKESL